MVGAKGTNFLTGYIDGGATQERQEQDRGHNLRAVRGRVAWSKQCKKTALGATHTSGIPCCSENDN